MVQSPFGCHRRPATFVLCSLALKLRAARACNSLALKLRAARACNNYLMACQRKEHQMPDKSMHIYIYALIYQHQPDPKNMGICVMLFGSPWPREEFEDLPPWTRFVVKLLEKGGGSSAEWFAERFAGHDGGNSNKVVVPQFVSNNYGL